MATYATLEDLKAHWPALSESQHEEAEQKLKEAHIHIRGLYRDVESRVQSGDLDDDVVQLVICRVVKRALEPVTAGLENVSSVQQAQAGFSQTLSFASSGDGSLYLKKDDKRLLGIRDGDSEQVFSIRPGG